MSQLWSILVAMVMLSITHAQGDPTTNVMTTYFGSHTFLCNNDDVNVTSINRPAKMYWMLPNGKLVSKNSDLEKKALIITEWMNLAYNLTITRITTQEFGYYTCILRYPNDEIKVVRFGLNLNGPDYSDLHEQYRLSAITGAIAAAVLLGVVGLACIIWHCRFSKRNGKETEGPSSEQYVYENSAAVPMEDIEVVKKPAPADHYDHPVDASAGTANGTSSNSIDVKL